MLQLATIERVVGYSLVKKHGGYIEVQSDLNAGTTFSIYLPIGHISGNADKTADCRY
jgi:nitrogen-specific signal transduction histidine kinase